MQVLVKYSFVASPLAALGSLLCGLCLAEACRGFFSFAAQELLLRLFFLPGVSWRACGLPSSVAAVNGLSCRGIFPESRDQTRVSCSDRQIPYH